MTVEGNTKGKIIQKQIVNTSESRNKTLNVSIIVFTFFLILFAIFLIYDILNSNYNAVGNNLVIMCLISVGIFLAYYSSKTQIDSCIYENGFIPNRRSLKDGRCNIEPFIPWNKVVNLTKSHAPANPTLWSYNIQTIDTPM